MNNKQPTPKCVRYHYARVMKLRRKLDSAYRAAYRANVLKYGKDEHHVVCNTLWESWLHFEEKTEKQLANAMKEEIRMEMYK